MGKNNNIDRLFEILRNKVSEADKAKFYTTHSINREMMELMGGFAITLVSWIHKTYLGYDMMNTPKVIREHFDWCFNKTAAQYKKEEGINLNNHNLSQSFYEYFSSTYYIDFENNGLPDEFQTLEYHKEYFTELFDLGADKTMYELELILETYHHFIKTIYSK